MSSALGKTAAQVVPFSISPADVIGMKMRDQDGADLGCGRYRRHSYWPVQVRGVRLPLALDYLTRRRTMTCVLPILSITCTRQQGIGMRTPWSPPRLGERRLGFLDRGILDESGISAACARYRHIRP